MPYSAVQRDIRNGSAGTSNCFAVQASCADSLGIIARVSTVRLGEMPNGFLCPKCHGQRTISCAVCAGTGKRSIAGVPIGACKECNGSGCNVVISAEVVAKSNGKLNYITALGKI
jgi:hypothetical protein